MNNFTPRAQQVLAHARREADRFNHHYIGTEHLLLGLLKLGKGVAVTILENLGVELTAVRRLAAQVQAYSSSVDYDADEPDTVSGDAIPDYDPETGELLTPAVQGF